MSKQCPHCGSYNTESSISGNVGYGLTQVARFAVAGSAALIVGAFNHTAGHAAGHNIIHNTKDWGEDINRHHCCSCGKDFK